MALSSNYVQIICKGGITKQWSSAQIMYRSYVKEALQNNGCLRRRPLFCNASNYVQIICKGGVTKQWPSPQIMYISYVKEALQNNGPLLKFHVS